MYDLVEYIENCPMGTLKNRKVSLQNCTVRRIFFFYLATLKRGRRGGLMVSALDSGSSGPGSGPGRGHCVVFLGKTLYSHGASLRPGV